MATNIKQQLYQMQYLLSSYIVKLINNNEYFNRKHYNALIDKIIIIGKYKSPSKCIKHAQNLIDCLKVFLNDTIYTDFAAEFHKMAQNILYTVIAKNAHDDFNIKIQFDNFIKLDKIKHSIFMLRNDIEFDNFKHNLLQHNPYIFTLGCDDVPIREYINLSSDELAQYIIQ
jgi:hypothetical protein